MIIAILLVQLGSKQESIVFFYNNPQILSSKCINCGMFVKWNTITEIKINEISLIQQ